MLNKKTVKLGLFLLASCLGFFTISVEANDAMSIGDIASNITKTFANLVKLITAAAYLGGFGLTVAALFKFKQHKENPQQVQMGTCITMLIIGVCLIFLPSIVKVGGQSVFGGSQEYSGPNGVIVGNN